MYFFKLPSQKSILLNVILTLIFFLPFFLPFILFLQEINTCAKTPVDARRRFNVDTT